MDSPTRGTIYLDEYEIDPERKVILRAGKLLPLNPKAFDVLLALIEGGGTVVSKDDLLERVWPGQFVEENNLTVHISSLRKLLGEKVNDPKYIVTVPGSGYKFVGVPRYQSAEDPVGSGPPNDDRGELPARKVSPRRRHLLVAAIGAVLVLAMALTAYLVSRQSDSTRDARIASVAILPFKPLVEEQRDDALELGMSDTLISAFSRIRTLTVRPMSAVRRYTSLDQDSRSAGRELGVESVLDGSIQRTGERLRVSARLVRVADGTTLWSETFDEQFTDIFAVQDSISQKIIRALAVELSGEESRTIVKKYTENSEAYSLYVKGRFLWSKLTPDDLKKSLDFYSQAIALDPNYALAHAGVADSYNLLGSYGFLPLKESHPKARAAAEKALQLDDDLAEAHASLAAVIADFYWDWAEADRHFKRAIELNPNYLVARTWYSQHLARMGRLDESIEEAKRAKALDPVSSSAGAHVGLALYRARRFDEAGAELREVLQLNPSSLDAHLFLGFVYLMQGKGNDGIAELETVVRLSGRNAGIVTLLAYGHAISGNRSEARTVLEKIDPAEQGRYHLETALAYMALGDPDAAFKRLDDAYRERAWQLGFLAVEPLFDPLRPDPRFADLLRRLDLPSA